MCAALGAHLDELHLKTIGTKPLPSPADLLIQLRNLPAREAQWRLEDYLKELRSRMHAGDIVRYSRAVEQWATVKRAELDPKLLLASKRGFMEVVRKAKAFDEYTRVFADFHPRIIDDEINAIFEQISASE
ncbi:MAG: hypothetical protein EA376_01825 [Phycisphaeraceae bacterium]|nr:MAG: hypothetical protein EA376_01825 [Phycisphaeraceae bacterium]